MRDRNREKSRANNLIDKRIFLGLSSKISLQYRRIAGSKGPAKRSQHENATYRNIVGRNMLGAFGRPAASCCDILGVVVSSLNMVKFEPTTRNMSPHGATG